MITIVCDRCEREIQFGDDMGGRKVECPHCGDVNRVPGVPDAADPGAGNGVVPASAVATSVASPDTSGSARPDRAAEAGLPPDSGEEVRVRLVRRCWFRSRPLAWTGAALAALGGVTGIVWGLIAGHAPWTGWLWAAVSLAGSGTLAWWWIVRFTTAVEITNKRTVAKIGLFSKATSEVVHDNIRNVQVTQSFWQRLFGAGTLGLSSSGQDGVEIEVSHLPRPDQLRKIIDLYRPL